MNLGQFFELHGAASNIVGANTSVYTVDMFNEDFPQFTEKIAAVNPGDSATYTNYVPPIILDQFIVMANAAIQEGRWFEKWRWAMGLYIAHYATLYLKTFQDGTPTAQIAANSGALVGSGKL